MADYRVNFNPVSTHTHTHTHTHIYIYIYEILPMLVLCNMYMYEIKSILSIYI